MKNARFEKIDRPAWSGAGLVAQDTGTIPTFNTMDPFSRQRITAKSLPAFAEKTKALMRQMYPSATNEDMLIGYPMLPRLVENDGSVGAKVAVVDALSGEWAGYYYQGMTTYMATTRCCWTSSVSWPSKASQPPYASGSLSPRLA